MYLTECAFEYIKVWTRLDGGRCRLVPYNQITSWTMESVLTFMATLPVAVNNQMSKVRFSVVIERNPD